VTVLSIAPIDPDHDDVVHPDRGRAVAAANRAGHRNRAPNSVIIALAMFLTAFVMGPVLHKSYDDGIKRWSPTRSASRTRAAAAVPLRGFMQKNVREKDLKLFMDLSARRRRDAGRNVAADSGAAFMIFRTEARLRDRLPLVPAVSDHRPRGRLVLMSMA